MSTVQTNQRYTYQDYLTWDDNERWEIIDGAPYNMTPSPNRKHEDISRNLYVKLAIALQGTSCVPYDAAFDVVLAEDTVVQPDILVVCDREKLTDQNVQGAPDVAIEILSPNTSKKDRTIKREVYERYGVKEFLIIDPVGEYIECYRLAANQKYGKSEMYADEDTFEFTSLPNVKFQVAEIFQTPE